VSNSLLSPKVYANVGLKLLKNNLVAAKLVSGEYKDMVVKPIQRNGQANGTTVYVKRPPEFTVRDGAVASVQDVVEGEIAVTIDKQKGIDVEFTSLEETLTVDSLLKSKVMASAMSRLANQIDGDIHAVTKQFYSWVGTPGQAINSYADLTKAPQRLDEQAVETDGRVGFMHPSDAWAMLGSLSGLTAQTKEATDALTRAKLPVLGNIDWYSTQNAATVTTGTRDGNAVIDGANQDVAYSEVASGNWTQTLSIDNVGNAKTVAAGEVFTIADVYAVNPITKERLDYLQQFTVITGGTSAATGTGNDQNLDITISPPIISSGAFQTVSCRGTSSTAPDDNAAIQWMGSDTEADTDNTTYKFATVFRPEAIALVSAKLIMPYSGEAEYATDPETGLTLRYWRSSDSTNDTHMHRFDVVYGVKNVDKRRGVRLSGTA
jgi:hypothetical protein